jgi:hypothetical protein
MYLQYFMGIVISCSGAIEKKCWKITGDNIFKFLVAL